MKVEISTDVVNKLQKLLDILDTARQAHEPPVGCNTSNTLLDDDVLIEPWHPSGWVDENDNDIDLSCPNLTVGVLRLATEIKTKLKM